MTLRDFGIQNLTKNCNETLILAILTRGKKHGYQLALEVEEKSEGYFMFNHGTLYPILHKLEKEGLVDGAWEHEGQKRKRKYYILTTKGRKYLTAQKLEWQHFIKYLSAILGENEK
jgi:PadR family transcriptional regulator PadR